jgi:hypothetical protein
MKNQVTLKFYADPGHGWLAVKINFLVSLGVAGDISPYSYVRGETAYLEEDCDASRFIKAAKEKGIQVDIKESHTDRRSPIRSYESYSASKVSAYSTYLQNKGIVV